MKESTTDILTLLGLFALLVFFSYLFFNSLFIGTISEYASNSSERSLALISNSFYNSSGAHQFYQNMRFPDNTINYWIEPACDSKKRGQIIEAFSIISEKTPLRFVEYREKTSSGIMISCTDQAPEPQVGEKQSYYVAGEGGPTDVINASGRYIITSGRVSLFRPERCNQSKIALHEILHVLGFDHSTDTKSIMYPITNCDQTLDQGIIDEIYALYKIPSLPDLAIDDAQANRSSRFLFMTMAVGNYGYQAARNVTLSLYSGDQKLYDQTLGDFNTGIRKVFTLQNLRIPPSVDVLTLKVYSQNKSEISLDNNVISLKFVKM